MVISPSSILQLSVISWRGGNKADLGKVHSTESQFLFKGVCCLQTCIYSSFPAGLLGMGAPCWCHSKNDNCKDGSLKGWTDAITGDAFKSLEMLFHS